MEQHIQMDKIVVENENYVMVMNVDKNCIVNIVNVVVIVFENKRDKDVVSIHIELIEIKENTIIQNDTLVVNVSISLIDVVNVLMIVDLVHVVSLGIGVYN